MGGGNSTAAGFQSLGVEMNNRALAVLAAAAVCCFVSGEAEARRARCALPAEMSAMQAAAIQQELMVAALTCNEVARFNAFQTGFGPELRISDGALARMFRRLYGPRGGEAAYHAFKTRLANQFSMRSIQSHPAYCREAGALLDAALASDRRPALVTFVGNLNATVEELPVQLCASRKSGADPVRRRIRRR